MQLLPEGKAPLVMAFCPVYLEILVDTCLLYTSLSCGAGTLSLEDEEFAGLGGSKIVDNDGAVRKMQLECGMGTLEVSFTE